MDTETFLSFYNQGLNDKQIASLTNVTSATVGRFRKSLALPRRNLIDRISDQIIEFTKLNLTDKEISRKLNVSSITVSTIRKKLNLPKSPYIKTKFETIEDKIKGKILVRSRSRAKKLNLDFNIDVDDIILNEYCPILNIKLDYIYKKQNNISAASLDRIDNSKGYVKNNIIIISVLANTMKNSASIEQLKLFCNNIPKILENI